MNKIIISKKIDFFLIKFPIWLPITFFIITKNFGILYLPFLILLLFIGELHFGSTYIFFMDKNYRTEFIKNSYIYIIIPIMIIIFCFFVALYFSISSILFLILLFNFFHVNRQSIGIFRIFNHSSEFLLKKIFEILIYFFSFSLCLIGLLKFVFKSKLYFDFQNDIFFYVNLLILISVLFIILIMFYKKSFNLNNIFTYLTGVLMFYPVFLTDNLIDVFAMGVAMHYTQYIAITWSIFKNKSKQEISPERNLNQFASLKNITILLFIYAIFMLSLSNFNIQYKNENIGIYIIPIFFQLIHFYLDTFLWKFSNTHTRENLLPFLFSK
jgi:hypothetical protein